ncbi:MAG: formyltransferase family protein [Isosphaeraceae bacterium]
MSPCDRMRTVLICHHDDPMNRRGLAAWLGSFTDLVGLVVIRENKKRLARRIRREIRRVGLLRFADVVAFRTYYRLFLGSNDQEWERQRLCQLTEAYGNPPATARVVETADPNARAVEAVIRELAPDLMIARCKTLLKPRVFNIPVHGTFVMHPGICPEYRNAHGCFWALARGDRGNVGATLLKIDEGVDTGPVYGYFRCDADEFNESHVMVQHRAVLDNLDSLKAKLLEIGKGRADTVDTTGRPSHEWGQPWLTAYLVWKLKARWRRRCT